jgi:1-acyl-sn-glycerol-3-phosphate acyltransferase
VPAFNSLAIPVMRKMEKWSWGYAMLKAWSVIVHRAFYSKVCTVNAELVPQKEAVIFAPNHQNALMDAMAIILTLRKQIVFVARADIFKKKSIAAFLYFLKILPVYRMRDGYDSLGENDEIFNILRTVLHNRKSIGVMPEGNHGDKHTLRSFKKGIFRIAFEAQRKFGTQAFVKIVPVGIDYSNYQNFQSDLLVNYGEPIDVSLFWKSYEENPVIAINNLRDLLAERLSVLMHDIRSDAFYEANLQLSLMYCKPMTRKMGLKYSNPYHRLQAKQRISKALDAYFSSRSTDSSIKDQCLCYIRGIAQINFRDWLFQKNNYNLFGLLAESLIYLLFLPIYLYGLINNYIPYKIPVRLGKAIKDPQFISSSRFALAIVTFLLFYPLQILIVAVCTNGALIPLLYALSLPLSGWFTFKWYIAVKKLFAKWRYRRMVKKGDVSMLSLQSMRKKLIQFMDTLMENKEI